VYVTASKKMLLVAWFLMAKIIQLIDNTPQQSHNPSQQLRNPPQQIYALHFNSWQLFRTNRHTSAMYDCRPKFADGRRCTCSLDFGGESHTTDRQYTPAVSQCVIADTQSAAAALRFTPISVTFVKNRHIPAVRTVAAANLIAT
jgi:hypothetical protein